MIRMESFSYICSYHCRGGWICCYFFGLWSIFIKFTQEISIPPKKREEISCFSNGHDIDGWKINPFIISKPKMELFSWKVSVYLIVVFYLVFMVCLLPWKLLYWMQRRIYWMNEWILIKSKQFDLIRQTATEHKPNIDVRASLK